MVARKPAKNDEGARDRDRLAAPVPAHALRLCVARARPPSYAMTGTPSTGRAADGAAIEPLRRLASVSDPIPRIAIVYDPGGRGSAGFNELAWEGAKRAADRLGAELKEVTAEPDDTDADREARLTELADARYSPIFVIGSTYAGPVAKVAPKYPQHLVRHGRRRQRGRAERDRHPVPRRAGLLPRRRGRCPHVEDGQGRLRRRRPDPAAPEVRGGIHGRCPGGRPARQGPGRVPLARARRQRAHRPGQGQERRAGHVRRGRRRDLRHGRRRGQRGHPGCPRSGLVGPSASTATSTSCRTRPCAAPS